MEFIKKNIKWIGLGGCILILISLFLPFATVSATVFGQTFSESVTYIDGDGKFVLMAAIAAGVLIFFKKELISLIPLGIGAGITIYSAINVGSAFESTSNMFGSVKTGFGFGFYLLILGLLVAIGSVIYSHFVLKKNASNITNQSSGLNQMPEQGYQPYNYNQPVQPMEQPSYGQPFVNNPVNEVQQPMEMPTSTVDTNIFNQAPVEVTPTAESNVVPNVVSQPVVEPVVENTVIPNQDVVIPNVITCSQCGASLNSNMQFCDQCGNKLN